MNQFISRAAALFVYRDPVEGRCAACGLPERQHLPFRTRVHHVTQREASHLSSRLAERAAAPRAGCLEGNIFLSARVCII